MYHQLSDQSLFETVIARLLIYYCMWNLSVKFIMCTFRLKLKVYISGNQSLFTDAV